MATFMIKRRSGGVVAMVPSLLVVKLLFRFKPELEALHHVEQIVSMFVDSSVELPLAKACKFGSLALMDRIMDSQFGIEFDHEASWSIRSFMQSEELYQMHQFNVSLLETVRRSDVAMTKWLFEHFKEFLVIRKVVEEGAAVGDMETLEYFLDNDIDLGSDDDKGDEEMGLARYVMWGGKDAVNAIRAGHPEVAMWLYEHVNVNREEYDTLKAGAAMGDVEFF